MLTLTTASLRSIKPTWSIISNSHTVNTHIWFVQISWKVFAKDISQVTAAYFKCIPNNTSCKFYSHTKWILWNTVKSCKEKHWRRNLLVMTLHVFSLSDQQKHIPAHVGWFPISLSWCWPADDEITSVQRAQITSKPPETGYGQSCYFLSNFLWKLFRSRWWLEVAFLCSNNVLETSSVM